MKEELKEIKMKLEEFEKKYECELEIETKEIIYAVSGKTYRSYNLKAILPQICICEVI